MKWFKDNKQLLYKYLLVMIFNIILHILINFYFKESEFVAIYLLFAVLISDLIIYYIKGVVRYKYYLDIICNIILGFILLFTKDFYIYTTSLFSIVFANNIVFMRSRLSEKLLIRSLQYFLILLVSLLCVSINYIFVLI